VVPLALLLAAGCAAPPATVPGDPPARADEAPALLVRPRAINLGRLRPGAGHTRTIEARAASPGTVITSAGTDDPGFSLRRDVFEHEEDKAAFILRFAGSREIGPVAAEAWIGYRAGTGEEGAVAVPVVGAVAGDLRIPRGIYLHRRGGRFAPRKVVITRRSGKTVHIRSVEDLDGMLGIDLVEPRSENASFVLEVRDRNWCHDGSIEHQLLLTIDDPLQRETVIEYRIDSHCS